MPSTRQPTQPTALTPEVVMVSLNNLTESVNEIKDLLAKSEEQRREFERCSNRERAELAVKSADHDDRLDKLEKQLGDLVKQVVALEQAIQPLIVSNKILSAIAGIVGVALFGLIMAILTHQIRLP